MQATTTSQPKDVVYQTKFTGMAQRQRAWLITTRTQDRNLLPVFIILRVYQNPPRCIHTQQHFTGMAQRERAGLITPRSLVRIQFPVYYIIVRFTEPDRQAGRKT